MFDHHYLALVIHVQDLRIVQEYAITEPLYYPTTHGTLWMKYSSACPSGEHIGKVTPVPIPNTEVKLFEPMIVHTSVKVGTAGFLKSLFGLRIK